MKDKKKIYGRSLVLDILPVQRKINRAKMKDLTLAIQREFKNSFSYK